MTAKHLIDYGLIRQKRILHERAVAHIKAETGTNLSLEIDNATLTLMWRCTQVAHVKGSKLSFNIYNN